MENKDLISQLPDHVLHEILSKLPTKGSVKTGVLSKRWKNLWQRVPGLDLAYYDFSEDERIDDFINRFLEDLDNKSVIQQLKLVVGGEKYIKGSDINKWVKSVVHRGIQHLMVIASVCGSYNMNTYCLSGSIFMCETLVHLKLFKLGIDSFDSVSLPRLETMHLMYVWFSSDAALERLISSSPLLRSLYITEISNVEVLRVRSQTLDSLYIRICGTKLVIDAPRLKSLSLEISQIKDLALNSTICSLVKLEIRILSFIESDFDSFNSWTMKTLPTFLAWISNITNLHLSCYSLKVFNAYSIFEPLPEFSNLTHLEVSVDSSVSDLGLLPAFLATCPSLKSLELNIYNQPKIFSNSNSPVPKCLLTSLEIVKIYHSSVNNPDEIELVKYFLGNAAVLKEFTYQFYSSELQLRFHFVDQIFECPKRSSACQLFVHF